MKKIEVFYLSILSFIFISSGCVVRTYPVTKDRADQVIDEGNAGYLRGEAKEGKEVKERKSKRTSHVVEIELHSPIRFEKFPKAKQEKKVSAVKENNDKEVWGNRGFITERSQTELSQPVVEESFTMADKSLVSLKEYKVQKGDTLQKISKKFYGTTVKWNEIYEANRSILRSPDNIYPGQIINVPLEMTASRKTDSYLK